MHRPAKILIVEDDAITAKLYEIHLQKEGHTVDVEADGSNAFYRIFSGKYDLILLDLMLPGMNGMDILKKFRAQTKFRDLPIVIMTSNPSRDRYQDAVRFQANHFFSKSENEPADIVAAINALLTSVNWAASSPQLPPVPLPPTSNQSAEGAEKREAALVGAAAEEDPNLVRWIL